MMEPKESLILKDGDLVKYLLKQKEESLHSFSIRINMPYSTLRGALLNPAGASLSNVKVICKNLGITLDDFILGMDVNNPTKKEPPTNKDEGSFNFKMSTGEKIDKFMQGISSLSDDEVRQVFDYIDFLNYKKEKA